MKMFLVKKIIPQYIKMGNFWYIEVKYFYKRNFIEKTLVILGPKKTIWPKLKVWYLNVTDTHISDHNNNSDP